MFNPSEKQMVALANMEKFNWINSNREHFENYIEFQQYFDLLSNKSKKKSKILNNIKEWKITQKELDDKIKIKKDNYYNNEDSLKSYAINYINRYFPSKSQLINQLSKKTTNKNALDNVFKSVENMIDENNMINNLGEQLKQKWKNINYISQKLYSKKYDGWLIKKYLDILKSWDSLLEEHTLEKKIKYYQNKWMSKKAIFLKFYERWEDKTIINTILDKCFDNNIELENIINIIGEYRKKDFSNKVIITKLLWRWFAYNIIKDYL